MSFNCTSMTVSGGEGWVGEMTLNYHEDGTFKDITMGAGVGAEWQMGTKEIAAASAGATAMEYVTIGRGADGGVTVKDVGITAGAGIGAGVANGLVGEEINLASVTTSFITSETTVSGALPDALRLK